MKDTIFEYLKKPELYAQSTSKFWDDEHISKGMLEAHLNPNFDAASRKPHFIDSSVEWINKIAPAEAYRRLLDLGCGPGLYTERLYKKGYSVTGMDLSKRSIEYATSKAVERNRQIHYICENYLHMNYHNEFDIIILIYCDYAALTEAQRKIIMKNIHSALKKGGKLIFDVFTDKRYKDSKELKAWSYSDDGGFWRPNAYLCLEGQYFYENNIKLDQYVIIDEKQNVDVFRIWDQYYTRETLVNELMNFGFNNIEIYSDVSGKEYEDNSETLCAVVTKE